MARPRQWPWKLRKGDGFQYMLEITVGSVDGMFVGNEKGRNQNGFLGLQVEQPSDSECIC